MRRTTTFFAALLLGFATTGTAVAMQPPAEAAQQHFGCVDGQNSPVAGHPGAAGIVAAAAKVKALTGDPTPTAWNAVEHAGPIEFGGC